MGCLSPFLKVHKHKNEKVDLWLNCGKCVNCVIARRSDWTFRLLQEHQDSQTSKFVTLTYNDKYLKYGIDKTLYYKDLQDYFKRLRKINSQPIKYFAVGEYGEKNGRPHYHAIIFNANPHTISKAWALQEKAFTKPIPLGIVHTGTVTQESIHYVTKYIHDNKGKTPDGSEVQKALMSKNLGLGYIKRCGNYHRETNRTYVIYPGGYKQKLPRYYAKKIWENDNDRRVIYKNEYDRRQWKADYDSGRIAWINSQGTPTEKATYPIYQYNQQQIDLKEIEKIRYLEHMLNKKARSLKV